MRLIDAESMVIELMDKWRTEVSRYGEWSPHITEKQAIESFMKFIEERSTAYDVDKVLEQLEGLKDTEQDDSVAEVISTRIWNKSISKAIEIVKKGGAE